MASNTHSCPQGDRLRVFKGTFIHSTDTDPMKTLDLSILGVNGMGKIVFIDTVDKEKELAQKWHFRKEDIRELQPRKEFFIPGLVDTHIHAPQYPNMGSCLDLPLLDWLTKYTFPVEAKFSDLKFAEETYKKVVRDNKDKTDPYSAGMLYGSTQDGKNLHFNGSALERDEIPRLTASEAVFKCGHCCRKRTLSNGTTTACYFATIHTDSTLKLCDITNELGQRAFVGKVCMDVNVVFPVYKELLCESVSETERFVAELTRRKYPLVKPIVTPRFGLSCSSELLQQLGSFANRHNLHIQSHISESRKEIEAIMEIFPDCENYSEVYDKHSLLTDKTIMAHGVYLSNEELELFQRKGVAISHCPNSNTSLCSGLFNARNALNHKVKVGLGTDVSGGYSPSVLNAMRCAIDVTKILSLKCPDYEKLSYQEVFRLATLGGSQALGLGKVIGNFEVGKDFDAILVKTNVPDSPFEVFPNDSQQGIFEKFLYLGDDRNMVEVYVAGKKVKPFAGS